MEYACVITTADWINIASVIVNICIAIWITHILQNKYLLLVDYQYYTF
jgi:hypothetical protein